MSKRFGNKLPAIETGTIPEGAKRGDNFPRPVPFKIGCLKFFYDDLFRRDAVRRQHAYEINPIWDSLKVECGRRVMSHLLRHHRYAGNSNELDCNMCVLRSG